MNWENIQVHTNGMRGASICAPFGQFKVTAIAGEIIGTYGFNYAEFGIVEDLPKKFDEKFEQCPWVPSCA